MEGSKMNEINPRFAVYLEYKPRLSVAQIVVSLSRKSRINSNFSVCKTGLSLEHKSDKVKTDVVFDGLRLVPPTSHSMQWVREGELQMRVQAHKYISKAKVRNRERVLSGDCSSDEKEDESNVSARKIQYIDEAPVHTGAEVSLLCSSCGQHVVKGRKFERILPLPSDNWQELTDSFFCCQHSNKDHMMTSQRPLVPRLSDFLYSDTSFVMVQSALQGGSISTKQAGQIECSRCSNLLGRKTKAENGTSSDATSIMLHRYQVTVQHSSPNSSIGSKKLWLDTLEKGITNMLLKYAETQNCFRFLLETRKTPSSSVEPYLLIWLMDPENVLYEASVVIGQSESEVMKPKSVAKIIYKDCFTDTTISEQWRKDLGAHCFELPEVQCDDLLQLLMGRTELLPDCLRAANDFMVSYLETGLPCLL